MCNKLDLCYKLKGRSYRLILQKKKIKNKKIIKIYLEGRVYKLSIKKTVWNFRFNRFNKTLFLKKNLNIKKHFSKYRREFYLSTSLKKKELTRLIKTIYAIRRYNIYTTRGIYISEKWIYKKEGRISGYF